MCSERSICPGRYGHRRNLVVPLAQERQPLTEPALSDSRAPQDRISENVLGSDIRCALCQIAGIGARSHRFSPRAVRGVKGTIALLRRAVLISWAIKRCVVWGQRGQAAVKPANSPLSLCFDNSE